MFEWKNRNFREGLLGSIFSSYEKLVLKFLLKILRNEKKVLKESRTDELTRLPNLKAARALIPHWMEKAHGNFYLGFVDIDYFKSVNDCHSHQAGDFVLIAFAAVASKIFTRRIFRVGGEEFLWCFEGTEQEVLCRAKAFQAAVEKQVAPVANILIRQNAGTDPNPSLIHYPVTVSQGIAQSGVDGCNFEALKLKADEETYLAKDAGRNGMVFRSKLWFQGQPPTCYTRGLLRALHERAKQRGFTCWWQMQEQISSREKDRMIRHYSKWGGHHVMAGMEKINR